MRLWTRLTGFSRAVEQRYGPLGGRIATGDALVHYLADGPSNTLPVVLLHGASGNLRDFSLSLMPLLARRHRVIALDRPGFGHSTPVPRAATLATQVRVLAQALRRIGIRRYCLLGHSYSGSLALAWALAEPEAVAGVTLVSGVAMDWGGNLGALYRLGGSRVLGPPLSTVVPMLAAPWTVETALREIFAPQPVPERYREEGGVELALRPQTFRINARSVNILHRQVVDMMPRYPRLRCPVEIVHGEADTIVPAEIHAQGLKRVLPEAGLTLLPGIGHMPHHSEAETVAAAVDRMMRGASVVQ